MTRITLAQFIKEKGLNFNDLIKLGKSADPNKRYEKSELEELIRNISALSHSETEGEINYQGLDTQLVKIRIPGKNLYYVTIMKAGKVKITNNERGELDLSDPRDSLDDLLDMLAFSAMFDPAKRIPMIKHKRKSGGKNKPPVFKPTKDKPGYIRDPALDNFFAENADALAYEALMSPSTFKKEHTINSIDVLEQIIEDKVFLDRLRTQGLEIECESITSYVAKNKGTITKKTKKFTGQIVDKEDIRGISQKLLLEYVEIEDASRSRLRKLCESPDSALDIYKELIQRRDKIGSEDKGEHFMICFRQLALEILGAALKAGASMDGEEFKSYISNTGKWVAYSKAADYVRTDNYIQRNIITILKDNNDESKKRDKIFEATTEIGKLIVDPNHTYGPHFLKFIISGLWMENLLLKEVEGGIERRTSTGASTEYTDGLGNLIERYETYDKLLKKSFRRLLEEKYSDLEELELNTQASCSTFGKSLYNELTPREQDRFSRLSNDTPLTKDGTYLGRILRQYIGINKKTFLDEIKKKKSE